MTYNAKPNISDGKVCKNLFPRADFVVILLLIYRGMQAACRLLIQVRYAFMWASMLGRWFPPALYFDPFSVLRLLPSRLTHHCQMYAQDCTYCRVTIKPYGLFIFYRPATVRPYIWLTVPAVPLSGYAASECHGIDIAQDRKPNLLVMALHIGG